MSYISALAWRTEYTQQFGEWLATLDVAEQNLVLAAIEILSERGPTLGRPLVDTISSSRHGNMKELRPPASPIRVLFAFDPLRAAILLLGGDKSGAWQRWNDRNVPVADQLFDEHLRRIDRERRKE